MKPITLLMARQIALLAVLKAEKRRRDAAEAEARWLESLNG